MTHSTPKAPTDQKAEIALREGRLTGPTARGSIRLSRERQSKTLLRRFFHLADLAKIVDVEGLADFWRLWALGDRQAQIGKPGVGAVLLD